MSPSPPYDPEARRDTPLALKLKDRIRRDGPMSVAEYMQACLQDPEHGYYVRQTAIGARGDFVTAPEISQVFGELIGLWCAVVWQQMGAPARLDLFELGPGRGTLMRDALRAARVLPGFLDAVEVHLVETNPALGAEQRRTLSGGAAPVDWNARFCAGSRRPTIVVANEFLDTQACAQTIRLGGGWRQRRVGLDSHGRLVFIAGAPRAVEPTSGMPADPRETHEGSIGEFQDFANLVSTLAEIDAQSLWAGLFIDYGHPDTLPGDTLQAVRNHAAEHPLTSPGEADLTVQVDFSSFTSQLAAAVASRGGTIAVDGPVTQAEFLGSLGILQRAARLMSANPARAHEIEAGVARLMAVPGMGDRFKAVAVRSATLPLLPGFPPSAAA